MSQDNIFQEIDEELRSDRMRALWRRFGPFVIGAAVAVVVIVAVNEGWTWYHANNAAQSSDELYAAFDAIDGGDLAAAQTHGHSHAATLARRLVQRRADMKRADQRRQLERQLGMGVHAQSPRKVAARGTQRASLHIAVGLP